jgi:hypothetical protein
VESTSGLFWFIRLRESKEVFSILSRCPASRIICCLFRSASEATRVSWCNCLVAILEGLFTGSGIGTLGVFLKED